MSKGRQKERAAEYFKRAPNYSGEALEFFRENRSLFPAGDLEALDWLSDHLISSHKFSLPDYGNILGVGLPQSIMEAGLNARLPYPSIAIEYECPLRGPLGHDRVDAPKRIVLGVEQEMPGLGFGAAFVCISGSGRNWSPSKVGYFFRYGDASKIHFVWFGESGAQEKAAMDAEGLDVEKLVIDTHHNEFAAGFQLLAALSCSNVSTDVIRPNREARAARPSSTLFDYHVLMIQPGEERRPSEDRGGTHASPRTHFRRGHIRHLSTGPRIWVNSCVVSPGAIGTVNKDYAIKKAKRPVRGANPEGPFAREGKESGQ